MSQPSAIAIQTAGHWLAAASYLAAAVLATIGYGLDRRPWRQWARRLAVAGLTVHGAVLLGRWLVAGHGPYLVKHEVLSSDGWLALALFLVAGRRWPQVRPAALVVFPAVFILVGVAVFTDPAVQHLPPSLHSVWLVFHVLCYKLALAALLVALAFSCFTLDRRRHGWRARLPDIATSDRLAYRTAGIGFVFWSMAMLAGSVWAYDAWGRFWGWDPVETWSLVTWGALGLYLHLRRFYGWRGRRAALLFCACFAFSIVALFFTSLVDTSAHSAYFA